MKKIITFAGITILFVLLSAPSFIKAEVNVGTAIVYRYNAYHIVTLRTASQPYTVTDNGGMWFYGRFRDYGYDNGLFYSITDENGIVHAYEQLGYQSCQIAYIPSLDNTVTLSRGGYTTVFYNNETDYEEGMPDELKPTWNEKLWRLFYQVYKRIYGFDPLPGSLIYDLANYPIEETEIVFPTNTPTPTPTPRPTPIPVQTIYVPSGNGDYTIIYQYPQPDGTITQSPYNPNIDVNVDVDCNCNGGSNNYNPQDPMYAPLDGLTWASVNGDLSESPAMSAGQSLDIIKAEVDSYDEPIKVVSNSFGALPAKWLGLVGLLGACLIVAGLIRTFLGG